MARSPILAATLLVLLGPSPSLLAHCDTMSGPVVTDARLAFDTRDVAPVLKWIRPADEKEIRELFGKTLLVRDKGPDARDLADRYFFETVVRLHRAGEGAPYTGLKPPGSVEPGIAMADAALDKGTVEELARRLNRDVEGAVRERFARALEARRHAGESVAAGREYVEAYVVFIHFVEQLHGTLAGSAPHEDRHP